MDKVMLSPRAQSITLKSLDLRCWSQLWEDEPDDWLEAAKRRGVENLTLVLFNVQLAPSIFCCKTLMHLHLTRIRVGSMLHCSVDLPLLETLIMSQISFKDTEDFMKLLFGCPKLEYLNIHGIKANGTIVEANAGVPDGGYFKHLSKLTRARISLFNVPFTAVYNVKFLSIWIEQNLSNKQINTFEKSLPVLENLRELQLTWFGRIHNWEVVVKMLQNCPILQTLTILKAENSASIEHWEYPDHVPECVSSNLTKFEVMHYEAWEADFRFATYILQNARLLQI
ncbi:putative FBD domain, leucine-rich repeat domain, L domain-containing protein [Medicago truncatula]|nr:F-box/FBD/LRR-repeat protein At4g26340 [Medicago truncatula]RHN55320.1 putative FBD domain, leucine-rich repeat domain, L domain-containing protein [Medicago truncatula]